MSLSKARQTSTKVGIALSADARRKLKQLANWIEREVQGNQDPRVRLQYCGGVVTNTHANVTYVSPMGALVQMFKPLSLVDAREISTGVFVAGRNVVTLRAMHILELTPQTYLQFIGYLYSAPDIGFTAVAKTLRTLK